MRNRQMSNLAKHLEDRDEDLFRGAVWVLAVFLAEPAAREPFQVNGIGPFSRHSLIHVLGISEEGVPVMSCREVHLVLYCTNLRKDTQLLGTPNKNECTPKALTME